MKKIILLSFAFSFTLSCLSDKSGKKAQNNSDNEITIDSNTYTNLVLKAERQLKNNNIEEAHKSFLEAHKINKNKPDALYGLGIYYNINCMNKGVLCDSAIFFLEKVKIINSSYRKVNYNLSLCYNKLDKTDSALNAINSAISSDSLDYDCFFQKAIILDKKGDQQNACKNIKKAINLGAPKNIILNYPYCN